MRRLFPLLTLAAALASGCGTPVAPQRTPQGSAQARSAPALAGPARATEVLALGQALAREVDPEARFVSLVGAFIQEDGTPAAGGGWKALYVGGVATEASKNPYARPRRHIRVAVTESGAARVAVTAENLALGMVLVGEPQPAIDSPDAMRLTRKLRPAQGQGPAARLTLSGHLSPQQFQRLLWRVESATQGLERPVTLDAQTGEVFGP